MSNAKRQPPLLLTSAKRTAVNNFMISYRKEPQMYPRFKSNAWIEKLIGTMAGPLRYRPTVKDVRKWMLAFPDLFHPAQRGKGKIKSQNARSSSSVTSVSGRGRRSKKSAEEQQTLMNRKLHGGNPEKSLAAAQSLKIEIITGCTIPTPAPAPSSQRQLPPEYSVQPSHSSFSSLRLDGVCKGIFSDGHMCDLSYRILSDAEAQKVFFALREDPGIS